MKEEGPVSEIRCERCESPLEPGDIRCAICAQAAPRTVASRDRAEVKVLRCSGCGAVVAYDPERQAPTCTFCESVVELETLEDPPERIREHLPFTVSREEAAAALRGWLGRRGWFRPSDLTSASRVEVVRPLWWVGWVFDGEALVSWAADSNAGSRRSSWAPHAGETGMEFDDILVSASRGLTDAEVEAIGPGYRLETAREEPEGADGATIEQYDVQRSQARERIVLAIESIARHRVEVDHVPGSRKRKVQVAVLLRRLVTRRVAFPAWVTTYRYREKLFRAVVCGQDAERVQGSAPISLAKVGLTALAVVLLLAILVAVIVAAAHGG